MRWLMPVLVIALLLVSGCAYTSVKQINSDPDSYMGKKVVVSGKVVAPMKLGSLSGFTLKQDKSSIMVSSEEVPPAGEEVVVKGTVVKGLFSTHYIFAERVS